MIKRKYVNGFDAIFASDGPSELEKVIAGFDYVTSMIIEQCEKDIELNRALGDQQAVIREQIKKSTITHARAILNTCCQRAIGKEVYHDHI